MIEVARRVLRRWKILAAIAAIAVVLVLVLRPRASEPALLVTLVPQDGSPQSGSGVAIARLDPSAPGATPRVLVRGFAAVGTPNVSRDGRRAVFAGRRSPGDPMEIWEVSVSGSSPRAIVRRVDCLDPNYLPDGRIVFARAVTDTGSGVWALHTVRPDGTDQRRITFGAAIDRTPAVLPDGRIVFRRHSLAGPGPGRLFEMNTDGTGFELFCEPADGGSIVAGPWSVGDRVIFAEAAWDGAGPDSVDGIAAGRRLVSVSARQPLAEREILAGALSEPTDESFSSVCALPDGSFVVSSFAESRGWIVRSLGVQAASAAEPLVGAVSLPGLKDQLRPVGIVLAAPRTKLLALTSVVDERKPSGTLLCLDVYNSRIAALRGVERGQVRSVRVLGADGGVLREAPVQADGSFVIEVPADQPLRLELQGAGGVLARDGSGFWVRPNENRGCVGCHEDPELSPDNVVPLAVEPGGPQAALKQLKDLRDRRIAAQ